MMSQSMVDLHSLATEEDTFVSGLNIMLSQTQDTYVTEAAHDHGLCPILLIVFVTGSSLRSLAIILLSSKETIGWQQVLCFKPSAKTIRLPANAYMVLVSHQS